jgi:ribosomal protein S18 acetylase RimI-like enzyme
MIVLVPMNEAEFSAYVAESVPNYALDKVRSGQWLENESICLAQEGFKSLLPQGVTTLDNYLFTIRDSSTQDKVGLLWFAIQEQAGKKIAYLYDILIFPNFRRMSYATQAFQALELEARTRGLQGIALHVFGHNLAAQALYRELGFEPTNINMFKRIGHKEA